ncbi:hypothetical protein L211DRAFT_854325 [Terfezia boudieri ATCC MYA-4762]|uniref:Uncharacterized protein n=1 Tax=Terfezia boudieri ATCC MYA-4762 TaxID=1051890 RepID=A0A3N4L9T7_9PEZI|nr:hypothetical protein L211DRAFT_854325 [Terfezia boudieri ATCC MYA-4762]
MAVPRHPWIILTQGNDHWVPAPPAAAPPPPTAAGPPPAAAAALALDRAAAPTAAATAPAPPRAAALADADADASTTVPPPAPTTAPTPAAAAPAPATPPVPAAAAAAPDIAGAVTPVNPYKKYADFPWGSKEFDPDTEFSGGRKVWETSTNPHTSKIRESQKRLLGPLLAFERAKDWKCQKVNRTLKAGVAEIRKKAYILHRWYGLSQVQQRFYLELGEGDNIPVYTIPEGDLEETATKPVNEFSVVVSVEPISRQAYVRFEAPVDQPHAQDDAIAIADRIIQEMEIAEGGAEDCLSDALEDIEPDSEDESDGQVLEDDLSSSDTEAELTDSNDDGKHDRNSFMASIEAASKRVARPGGDRSLGLFPSDPDDDNYEDEAEIQEQEQMDEGAEGDKEDEESQGYEEDEESQGEDEVEEEELDE